MLLLSIIISIKFCFLFLDTSSISNFKVRYLPRAAEELEDSKFYITASWNEAKGPILQIQISIYLLKLDERPELGQISKDIGIYYYYHMQCYYIQVNSYVTH